MSAGIFISELIFSDETHLRVRSNSIVVLTGPNNAGKSSVLKEIKRDLDRKERKGTGVGPVLKGLTVSLKGDIPDFTTYLKDRFEYDEATKEVKLSYNHKYLLKTIHSQIRKGRLPAPLEAEFVSSLTTSDRLGGNHHDRVERAAQILHDDEPSEIALSDVFRKAFGSDLILNRTSGGGVFHLGDRNDLPSHVDRLKPHFRKWMDILPRVADQGDGMRSFCRVMLELLIQPGSVMLIDEPEAFLHPPQIRQLARVIGSQTSPDTQIFVATHSDDFIKGLLDTSVSRITVVRLEKKEKINSVTALESQAIMELWRDPLLRTSGLLSALFHEVAVICEGESDARFFQALMDATTGDDRDPDFRFYHCGGKDRVAVVARSLLAVNVPTVVVVDLDVLSDNNKFLNLLETMGGHSRDIELDLKTLSKSVSERKARVTGAYFSSEVLKIIEQVKFLPSIPDRTIEEMRGILRESSPWARVKEDGLRGFVDGASISAFKRVAAACRKVGILLNAEGELEGLCRDISARINLCGSHKF